MFTSYRKRMVAVGIIGTAVLMAGCASQPEPSSSGTTSADVEFDWSTAEAVELTVSSIFSPGSTATNLIEDWMSAVTESTAGKITFDYYPTATLHPATEALSAMDGGLTDITFVSNGYFPNHLPVSNWDDIVVQKALADFGYPNTNIAGIGQMVVHYDNANNAAAAEMKDAGFIPLIPMLSGPSVLSCSQK